MAIAIGRRRGRVFVVPAAELRERDEWARACLLVQRQAVKRGDKGLAFFAGCVGWGCFVGDALK